MVEIIIKKKISLTISGNFSVELLIPLKEHHSYEPLFFVILRFETVEHYLLFPHSVQA